MVTTRSSVGHEPPPDPVPPEPVVTEDETPEPAERATVEDAPAERAVVPSPKRKR